MSRKTYEAWALTYQFANGRRMIDQVNFDVPHPVGVALFATRANARAAMKTCDLKPTRAVKVDVVIWEIE